MPSTAVHQNQIQLSDRAQKLIALINRLRALGADSLLELGLPKIAVIGNQSSGKSSLIEAVARIKVPRSLGTCTRCPMEFRLIRSNEPWKCQVKLRRGDKPEVKFGPPFIETDQYKLERHLRQAQLAILNPDEQDEVFLNEFLTISHRQVSFSSDVVCVEISSPDAIDLTFIDLPGLIQNVSEGEDKSNISLVSGLVDKYIEGDTLILLTIPMTDDFANQGAVQHAKEADPDGLRTIGVLTKPDAIDSKAVLADWLKRLTGETDTQLLRKHGFYVTKQPGPDDPPQISFDAAREKEKQFFKEVPWAKLGPGERERLGTRALAQSLSKMLSEYIYEVLPKINKEVMTSLDKNRKSLEALPAPPPTQSNLELVNLISGFCNEVDKWIEGGKNHEALIRTYRRDCKTFKVNIAATHPNFVPFRKNTPEAKLGWKISLPSEDDHVEGGSDSRVKSFTMDLDDVLEFVDELRTRELPLEIPSVALPHLIAKCLIQWEELCLLSFKGIKRHVAEFLRKIAERRFKDHSLLLGDVQQALSAVIASLENSTLEKIKELISLENTPRTLNEKYYERKFEGYLELFKSAPADDGCYEMVAEELPATPALPFGHVNYGRVNQSHIYARPPANVASWKACQVEMTLMAKCEAYFRVAYRRIIDDFTRSIDEAFLRALSKSLQPALMIKLGVNSSNPVARAEAYFRESENVAKKRSELLSVKERLEQIRAALDEFNRQA